MIQMIKKFKSVFVILGVVGTLFTPKVSYAYPVFAQNAYQNPREATGRIVCANCHLASKPVEIEIPQAVLPDTVFEAVVSIPYDTSVKQITAGGTRGSINIGSVLVLPEGFKLAPKDRLSDEIKAKTKGIFVQPYSKTKTNILVVGPVAGDKKGELREIVFPILSPDPAQDKSVSFLTYPVYVGGNRGRGQVYPTGEKSNNNAYTSKVAGQITSIEAAEKGKTDIVVATATGDVTQTIPSGLDIVVKVKDLVKADQPLTLDPNVGGFGQEESQIVLQNPNRIKGMIVFFFTVTLAQILLVLKKKQFEKVQAAEMNF
jgi:apocytochrome f|tara:strand:- start:873 stop:1820 length:948 start_codon:yes stop_codon:yes gene_type:complete